MQYARVYARTDTIVACNIPEIDWREWKGKFITGMRNACFASGLKSLRYLGDTLCICSRTDTRAGAVISQLHCYAYNVGAYIRIVWIVRQANRPSVGNGGGSDEVKREQPLIVGYVQSPDTAGRERATPSA